MDKRPDSSVEMTERSKLELNDEKMKSETREDIAASRMEIGETIEAIQERLTVATLSSDLKHEVGEQITNAVDSATGALYDATIGKAGELMNNVNDGLKKTGLMPSSAKDIIPFALIGIGIGALIMKSRSGHTNGIDETRHSSERIFDPQPSTSVRGAPASTMGNIKSKAGDMYESLDETVSDAGTRAKEIAVSGKDAYTKFFADNPLGVGLAAIGVGAAIGYALPLSTTEKRLMNPLSRNLMEGFEDKAEKGIEKIETVAGDALSSMGSETPDKPKGQPHATSANANR